MRVKFTHGFTLHRKLEILLLPYPGKDQSLKAVKATTLVGLLLFTSLEPGSDLIRSFYFQECTTCRLPSIKPNPT